MTSDKPYIYSAKHKIHPTRFDPISLHYSILEPLRYLFSFVPPEELRYHSDPKKTKIIIDSSNSKFQDTEVQGKPRILLNRGTYQVTKAGLTDNMAESIPFSDTGGRISSRFVTFISGTCSLTIEASEEGVCEVLASMVHHFLVWSRPQICQTFRFREFALPMQVSEAQQLPEDVEKFKIMISVPYQTEDSWSMKEDAVKIKDFLTNLVIE